MGTQRDNPLFFFSAGEPSGDIHAAELIEELRKRFPNARFVGYGGPQMQRAGCRVDVMLTELAVMWFGRVLWNLRTFLGHIRNAGHFFETERPDAVILVDFPGFNWKIAQKAKQAGIPVFYFMPPQLWAWGQWRIKKMKRLIDHVLCCLEFEEKWFKDHDCDVQRIGHPFLEEVRNQSLDQSFIDSLVVESNRPILTILPGSRNQEVAANLSDMLDTVVLVQKENAFIRPIVAAFSEPQAETIRTELTKRKLDFPVYVGRTRELMKVARCALAVSGSVSMELLAYAVPSVIYYRVGRFSHFVSRFFRRVKYITLTNLLAVDSLPDESIFYDDQVRLIPARLTPHEQSLAVFPEILTWYNASKEAACELLSLLDPEHHDKRQNKLRSLLQRVDSAGSPVTNAANCIEQTITDL